MSNNIKIAIEGMDGVGKSTIAKRIAKDFNMRYIEKPLTELVNIEEIDGHSNLSAISNNIYNLDNEIIKAWFFGMGNLYTILENQDSDIVIDRHFVSNYFWNGTEKSDSIFANMIELIGKPDITILLHASVETRLKRLYKRNPNDYDLTDIEKHVYGYDKMIYFLEKFDIPYILVDTDGKTIEDAYLEVSDIVNKIKNNNKIRKLVK